MLLMLMGLNHISYFSIWNRRDNDYGIPEHFVLDFSNYRVEESV